MKALLFGYKGKVGSIVLEKLEAEGIEVIKIEKEDSLAQKNISKIDFAIDFSVCDESVKHAIFCSSIGAPLLICTTGQTEKQIKKLEKLKTAVPIVLCQNTSVGTGFLLKVLSLANSLGAKYGHIHDIHNISKKDAPSGTALVYKNELLKQNIKAEISSEKANHNITSYLITLYLNNEIIKLKHIVLSKEVFAEGAIEIAKTLKNLPPKVYINSIFRGCEND